MTCPRCASRPDTAFESGCTCDHRGFPPCEGIAPGLAGLPAPLPGFDDYREHLLSSAADKPALAGWTARSEDDLGVMLIEGWAYVLDIVRFYDRRIASNSYLRTASDPLALRRLVALIGYRPRPAVAAKATLAVVASGRDPVLIPAGTRFRSKDSDAVPAQVFETAAPARIDPRHNGWELAPRRPGAYQGLLAFAPEAPGLLAGQFVFIAVAGRAAPTAARVGTLTKARMADGKDYRIVTLSPAPDFSGVTLDRIALYAMSQSASPTTFEVQESSPPSGLAGKPSGLKAPLAGAAKVQMGGAAKQLAGQPLPDSAKVQLDAFTKYGEAAWEQVDLAFGDTEWVLDGIYPQIAAGDRVVVEWPTPASGAEPHLTAATVVATALASVILAAGTPPVLGKATKLTLDKRVWLRRLHFRDVNAGRLVNPALTELPLDALLGTHAAAGTAEPLGDGIIPSAFAVAGENDGGALLSGSVAVDPLGQARLSGIAFAEQAADRLRAPIRYYGNLVTVSRGETVRDEVLGSADASLLYQCFRLRQKPLSYLPDPAAPRGVAAELEVRVNGIAWKQAESFLAARPGERVYIVRHDEAGETDIIFGESARPPSGVDNVTATYRFGAGAASPPPGTLIQMADPLPDISKVVAPLRARGGADAEGSESLRRNAPASTMARNRAVSLADYAAIVAAYPGVLASDVQWRWVEGAQRTGVRAWIVNDGGDVSTELAKALRTVGDLATPIRVGAAIADPHMLGIEVAIAAGYSAAAVRTAVRDRLGESESGLLALRRAPIGGVFFRSGLARNVAEVEGVLAARSIVLDGNDMPAALTFAQGHYPAFTFTVGEAS